MKKVLSSLVIVILIMSGCGEEEPRNVIDAHVDFLIYTNAWDNELSSPFTTKTFPSGQNSGLGGLLAVSYSFDGTIGLHVYDLACPHEKLSNIKLFVNSKIEAECNKCGSKFDIINGTGQRLSGPSITGLQVYRALPQHDRPGVFRVIR